MGPAVIGALCWFVVHPERALEVPASEPASEPLPELAPLANGAGSVVR